MTSFSQYIGSPLNSSPLNSANPSPFNPANLSPSPLNTADLSPFNMAKRMRFSPEICEDKTLEEMLDDIYLYLYYICVSFSYFIVPGERVNGSHVYNISVNYDIQGSESKPMEKATVLKTWTDSTDLGDICSTTLAFLVLSGVDNSKRIIIINSKKRRVLARPGHGNRDDSAKIMILDAEPSEKASTETKIKHMNLMRYFGFLDEEVTQLPAEIMIVNMLQCFTHFKEGDISPNDLAVVLTYKKELRNGNDFNNHQYTIFNTHDMYINYVHHDETGVTSFVSNYDLCFEMPVDVVGKIGLID